MRARLPVLAAAALALTAGLAALLPAAPAEAQTAQTVEADWSLIPTGVSGGDSFRLLFVTSTKRNAQSTNIADYNSFVQARANAITALQPFKGEFRALISTATVDARDNTATTYTSTNKGVPIYWLGGAKVADEYQDFYDGSWDSDQWTTESGAFAGSSQASRPWTGSKNDGTRHSSRYAGASRTLVSGLRAHSVPLEGEWRFSNAGLHPLFAMSPVITVRADTTAPKITGIRVTSTPKRGGTYTAGERIEFTVTFDEKVTVTVPSNVLQAPRVKLRLGSSFDADALYLRGSGTTEVVFVTSPLPRNPSLVDTDGVSIVANPPILLSGGAIKDAALNDADLSYAGLAAQSGHKVDPLPPLAPTGLTATPGNQQVTLGWSAPTPADTSIVGYQYQQRVGTGAWGAWTAIAGSRATTRSHTVPLPDVLQYGFRVRAQDAANDGAASAEATATPDDGVRPVRPAGFSATPGHARVTLSWSDPADATITRYQVRQGNGAWADIPGSGASTTSHTVTGLVIGRAYTFRIRAVDGVGAGTQSAAVSATPTAAPPDQVTDVRVTPAGRWPQVDRWLDVTWPPVPGADYYKVQWKSGDEAFVDDASRRRLVNQGRTRGGRMHMAIERLRGGVEYTVRVTARFPDRPEGPPSEEVKATPYPGLIETIAVTPGPQGLDVSWTPVSGYGLYGYKVYWTAHSDRYHRDVRSAEVMGGTTGAYSIPTADLPKGAGFDVWVAVLFRDVDGNEHEAGTSDEVTDVRPAGGPVSGTAPAAPGDVAAVAAGPKAIVLSWTAPVGAAGYTVQWSEGASGPWAAITPDLGASATGYAHTGLTAGATRYYRVRATNAAGDGAWSATVSATTATSAPGPVQGVTAEPGIGELTVRWTALPGAEHYKVQWKSGDVAFVDDASRQRITSVRYGAHMTIERLRSDTEYTVRVIAMWPGQPDSAPSAEATGTPLAWGVPQADPQPQVTVTPGPGSGRLRVSWDWVEFATGYEVKWWRTSAPGAAVEEKGRDLHTLEGLTPGVEYTVQVRAVYGAVEPTRYGAWSAAVTGTPLAPPVLTVSDARAQEGGSLGFAVALSAAAEETVTADYATSGGTARAGEDYEAASGTLTFAPGETEKTVRVAVFGDAAAEGEETVRLTLSNPMGATLARAAATGAIADALPPLTASIAAAPSEHAGAAFAVRIAFSAPLADGAGKVLRRHALSVDGGAVKRVQQVDGRRDLWSVRVKPAGLGAATLRLAASGDCAAAGSICTADGRPLSNALTAAVAGPVALSVADARAKEGVDKTIDFAVTLSRAASDEVTVRYVTRNGSAKAGEDYRRARGKLTFAAGETEKTVSVALLDDAKDEEEETFTLMLSRARGAVIADGRAVGTVENSDPMPQAWLARFGRTVASQAVDAVTARLEGLAPGAHATLAGQALDLSRADEAEALAEAMTGLARAFGAPAAPAPEGGEDPFAGRHGAGGTWDDGDASSGARSMTGRDLLLGSSLHFATGDEAGGAGFAAWGRAAHGSFDAQAGDVTLDGDVTTGFLGADVSGAGWLAGAAFAHSRGEGTFTLTSGMDSTRERGKVESTLTSVLPYARVDVSERVSAWGLAGYGTGEFTLTEDGDAPIETDLTMTLGAIGAAGDLIPAPEGGGFALALKSDAFWVRTESDAVANLAASDTDVTRLRLVLDASRVFETAGGTLTPSLEVGLRHDGGDAETGTGIEVGTGLRYAGSGLTVEGSVRGLVAHEDSDYEEWGASGSVRIDPGASGRGLSLTLAPTIGAASSGTGNLWSAADARGLAPGTEFEAGRRLDAEVGYGLAGPGRLGTVTPYAGLGLAGDDARTWRTGARWSIAPDVSLGLEARLSESAASALEHGAMLRGALRW